MTSHRTRTVFRRRAIVLVALVALVWCQVVAAAHACAMGQTAGSVALAASVADCASADDGNESEGSECPASDATSDWHKLPVFMALPASGILLAGAHDGPSLLGPARYDVPQGRAPPRPQLCCWLI